MDPIAQFQAIADDLLQRHYGIGLNDTRLSESDYVATLITAQVEPFAYLNEMAVDFDLIRSDTPSWQSNLPLTQADQEKAQKALDPEPDAFGRTGDKQDCLMCCATGTEYGDTCVTCGGLGWTRADHKHTAAMMQFELRHNVFEGEPERFSELDAPAWLTGANAIPGSTMDNSWFWQKHVLTLQVGESIETDFRTVTRVA